MEYNGKQVTIMSCSNCNANCEHCYISYNGNFTGDKLYSLCKTLTEKYKVIINGTEVLIHDDYFKSLAISNQNRVLTNGIIIYQHPEICNKIKKSGINRVALSYHFGSEVSSVSKKMVEDVIKILQKYGLQVELMCTITKENYYELESICEKAIELGVSTIRFFNCINTGHCKDVVEELCLTDKEIEDFFIRLRKVRNKYDINTLKIKRNGLFGKDTNAIKNNFKCNAGIDEVVITPDLNVYPCIFLAKPGFEIGKYENNHIELFDEINNDGTQCIAHQIFNRNLSNPFDRKLIKKR